VYNFLNSPVAFLISAPDGVEWSASRTGRSTSGERTPCYPLDRRLGWPQSRSGRGGDEDKSWWRGA
jgi:hypothetical protein